MCPIEHAITIKLFLLNNNTYSVTVHVLFKFILLGNICCPSRISSKKGMFLRYAESLLRVPKSFSFLSLGVHIAPEWPPPGANIVVMA